MTTEIAILNLEWPIEITILFLKIMDCLSLPITAFQPHKLSCITVCAKYILSN